VHSLVVAEDHLTRSQAVKTTQQVATANKSPNYAQQGSNRPSVNPQPGQKPQAGNQSQGHQHNSGQTGHSKRPDKAPSKL